MARRSKEDAERTRVRILASALDLFSKKGYKDTTFNDVAKRLSMTKGAIYWHFESKEKLLVALVDLALLRFRHQIEESMPEGELTFKGVAEMMIKSALSVVSDPKAAAFFRLMKCQVQWSDATMSSMREDLLSDKTFGPKEAFRRAIANDIRRGEIRETVDANEVTAVCLALWDGLVQAKLDTFLTCDLKKTLEHSYEAIWKSLKKRSK